MINKLNTNGKALLGSVVLVLLLLFAFLNGVPWEPKGSVAELRAATDKRLEEIQRDVRDIRRYLLGDPRR